MITEDLKRIIENHYRLQYGCFFSDIIDVKGTLYTFNDVMECFIWNHVFTFDNSDNLYDVLCNASKYFSTRNRKTCVYLDEYNNTDQNKGILSAEGFKCVDNEAWLMFPAAKKKEKMKTTLVAVEVNNISDLNEFSSVCTECFGKQYSVAIEREHNRFQVHKKVSHFVFTKDNEVVGIGSLYSYGEYVFIHNVGVKEQYRRKGFANDLMQHLINEAFQIGSDNAKLILQCDGGGFIEEMYLKLGFENLYRRWGYLKE